MLPLCRKGSHFVHQKLPMDDCYNNAQVRVYLAELLTCRITQTGFVFLLRIKKSTSKHIFALPVKTSPAGVHRLWKNVCSFLKN